MNTKSARRMLPHVFGVVGLALLVAGVWGKWGWEWAAICAGLPPAGFYLYGEIRRALASAYIPEAEVD